MPWTLGLPACVIVASILISFVALNLEWSQSSPLNPCAALSYRTQAEDKGCSVATEFEPIPQAGPESQHTWGLEGKGCLVIRNIATLPAFIDQLIFSVAKLIGYLIPEEIAQRWVQDTFQSRSEQQRQIEDAMRGPLVFRCALCSDDHVCQTPRAVSIDGRDAQWTVGTDRSLQLSDPTLRVLFLLGIITVTPIQIRSRIMQRTGTTATVRSQNHPDHMHEITPQEEVRALLDASLDHTGSTLSPTSRQAFLIVNPSCGLYVHFGSRPDFSLDTIKNFLLLWLTFEAELDSFNYASRIGGARFDAADRQDTRHSPRKVHNGSLSHQMKTFFESKPVLAQRAAACGNSLPIWLEHISSLESVYDAKELFQSRNLTVNIMNLRPESETEVMINNLQGRSLGTGTIEIRQHAGTFDSNEIMHWVHLIESLISFAESNKLENVKDLCLEKFRKGARGVPDARGFLDQICCAEETKEYYLDSRKRDVEVPGQPRHEGRFPSRWAPQNLGNLIREEVAKTTAQDRDPRTVAQCIQHKRDAGEYGEDPPTVLSEQQLRTFIRPYASRNLPAKLEELEHFEDIEREVTNE